MKILLNNKNETFEGRQSMSIRDIIVLKNFTFKFLAIRVNGKPIKPDEFETTIVEDGDNVVVMHLISGG